MPSTSSTSVRSRARRASDSRGASVLARAGLTARGVIYILLGLVALLVAFGHGSHQADQQGALQLLADQPYGVVALWLLAIGFAAYTLWKLSEAAFGVAGEGDSAGPRLKCLGSAVVYASFVVLTIKVITGRQGNQSGQQQDATAQAMQHPAGRWLVGLIGIIVIIAGLMLILIGVRRKFLKKLRTSQMNARTRRIVTWLGIVGTCARGVVVALVGILIVDAAVTHDAAKSGGVDRALMTLRDQSFGPVLLILAALGLVVFGVYGLCEARWAKV